MNIGSRCASLLIAVSAAVGLTANAAINAVPDRISLNPNDGIDWSLTGPAGTVLPYGSFVSSTAGNQIGIYNTTGGDMRRLDQGPLGGWYGNFEDGTSLLYSDGSGALEIDPDVLFKGAGLQIQADYFGPFTAELTAYGTAGNPLGSVTGSGVSSGGPGGMSLFLGFLSDAFDVDRFVLRLTSAVKFPERFALDSVSLVSGTRRPPEFAAPIPESRHGALVGGVALLILGAWKRLRQRSE